MNKKLFLILIFFIFTQNTMFASGGFGGGVDQISQAKDREKFHLGKAVYNEEIELTAKEKPESQIERLTFLQNALPNPEKKRVNLPNLAGKLTEKQLDALEYFLSFRFSIKLEKNKQS